MSNKVPENQAKLGSSLKPHPIPEEVLNGNSSSNDQSSNQVRPTSNQYAWQLTILDKKVKRNGFSLPLHSYQITSWFIFALDTYAFYFINVVTFSYQPSISILLGVSYMILFLGVTFYAIMATRSDPTDPTVYA